MIRFHRNGLMVMKDSQGRAHILDPKESLKDIATYIWETESLKEYRIDSNYPAEDIKELVFVELGKEKAPRLRGLSREDAYCKE